MIELRDLRPSDRQQLLEWRNLPEVAQWMYTDHVITADEHDRWFDGIGEDPTRRYWIITLDSEDVGVANLAQIDRSHRRCSWAFYLSSASTRGRGVGSFVEHFVLQHVFEDLAFNKLCCEVLVENPAVIAMHERFGFRREAYLRQHIMKGGESTDVVALAILRDEWKLVRPAIEARLRSKGLIC